MIALGSEEVPCHNRGKDSVYCILYLETFYVAEFSDKQREIVRANGLSLVLFGIVICTRTVYVSMRYTYFC